MPLEVTRTIASVGCSIRGSGTVSTRTSRLPCQVTAFIAAPFSRSRSLSVRLRLARPRSGQARERVTRAVLGEPLHESEKRPFEREREDELADRNGTLLRLRRL